jgi:pimeloyl-ACP methyl ester carboxylesterase
VKTLVALAVLASCKGGGNEPAAITSEPVTFGSNAVPGTITHPRAEHGRYPGIVIIAGSGPTDRDWNSPLIASKNGSGKLLAEALARHDMVVLRYDKAGIGENKTAHSAVTFDMYRDDARAGLALLRARADVDPKHLFVAGHSEGGEHALRVALAEKDQIAGVLLLSAAGRTMLDVLFTQLTAQGAKPDAFRAELDDFAAGKPPGKTLTALGISPDAADMARELMTFDPSAAIAQITVPVFIYNGQHDLQVDPELDAKVLAAHHPGATLFLAPEADHVLKHEPKSLAELRENMLLTQARYNATDRDLDPATLAAILDWLAAHTRGP